MIDAKIAQFAKSQMLEGEFYNFVTGPDKRTFSFEVVTIKDYSIVVKNAIGGLLELPINKAEIYINESEKTMSETTRMPMPQQQPQSSPPGRPRAPRRTKAQIEADKAAKASGHPPATQATQPTTQPAPSFGFTSSSDGNFDSWQPPGKPIVIAPPSSAETQAAVAQSWQDATKAHPTMEGVRVLNEVEFEDNWIDKAVQEAGQNFMVEIASIIKTIYKEQPIVEPSEPKIRTCFDCVMVNVRENKCDKYGMTPPMSVISNAILCEGFLSKDEIPF